MKNSFGVFKRNKLRVIIGMAMLIGCVLAARRPAYASAAPTPPAGYQPVQPFPNGFIVATSPAQGAWDVPVSGTIRVTAAANIGADQGTYTILLTSAVDSHRFTITGQSNTLDYVFNYSGLTPGTIYRCRFEGYVYYPGGWYASTFYYEFNFTTGYGYGNAPSILSVTPSYSGNTGPIEPWGSIVVKFNQAMDPNYGTAWFNFENALNGRGYFRNGNTEYVVEYDTMYLRNYQYYREDALTVYFSGFRSGSAAVPEAQYTYNVRPEPFVAGGSPAPYASGAPASGDLTLRFNRRMDTYANNYVVLVDGYNTRTRLTGGRWSTDGFTYTVPYQNAARGLAEFFLYGFYSAEGYEMRQPGGSFYYGAANIEIPRRDIPSEYAYSDTNLFESYRFWVDDVSAAPTPTPFPAPGGAGGPSSAAPGANSPGYVNAGAAYITYTAPYHEELNVPRNAQVVIQFLQPITRTGTVFLNKKIWRTGNKGIYVRDGGLTIVIPSQGEFPLGENTIWLRDFYMEGERLPEYRFTFQTADTGLTSDWVAGTAPFAGQVLDTDSGTLSITFTGRMNPDYGYIWMGGALLGQGEWTNDNTVYTVEYGRLASGVTVWSGRGFRGTNGENCPDFDGEFIIFGE